MNINSLKKEQHSRRKVCILGIILLMIILLSFIFFLIGQADNKNNIAQLNTQDGYAHISYNELEKNYITALKYEWQFLPDILYNGAEYYNAQSGEKNQTPNFFITNIGDNTNYSKFPPYEPNGTATYRLYFKTQPNKLISIHFPYIYSSNEIYINNELKNRSGTVSLKQHIDNTDSVTVTFLTREENEIIVCATNLNDTYSGMYYIPFMGTTENVSSVITINNLVYLGILILACLIFLITFIIWFIAKTRPLEYLFLSLICLAFIIYIMKNTIVAAGLGYNVTLQSIRCIGFWMIRLLFVLFARKVSAMKKTNVFFQISLWLALCTLILTTFSFGLLNRYESWMSLINTISLLCGFNCTVFVTVCAILTLVRTKQNDYSNRNTKHVLYFSSAVFCAWVICESTSSGTANPIVFLTTHEFAAFLIVCCIGIYSVLFYIDIAKQNAVLRLKEAQQYKLFANVAHDIMSPVSLMSAYLEILDQSHTQKEQLQICHELKQSGKNIVQRAEKLQQFAQLMENQTLKKIVDAQNFFNGICKTFAIALQEKNIFLESNIDPTALYINEESFTIAIENILSNAIKHSFPQGKISLSCKKKLNKIEIEICDNGKGIPPHALPHLFDRYYTQTKNGTGLGLAIAKAVVLAHDGDIFVTSDKQTKFTIILPDITKI